MKFTAQRYHKVFFTHNCLNTTNARGKKSKAVVDAVATTIIPESYMGYRKKQRNKPERTIVKIN
ncbi:MAG: hypothetical protein ACI4JB_05530 [Porcipelethomonas sp.]